MVSIRLQRIGRKKMPHFRLIAQDKQKDPTDRSLEILGSINPRTKEVVLKEDKIKAWLDKGAQPTATVHNLLIDKGIIKAKKVKTISLSKKRLAKKAETAKPTETNIVTQEKQKTTAVAEDTKVPEPSAKTE
ncbi:MAG: 30S ribosomal protein S16 [Patescibacteria group bacterium]